VRLDDIDPAALMARGADRVPRAFAARATLGLSPVSIGLAFADWWLHLALSPGKQLELARKAARKWLRYGEFLAQVARGAQRPCCIEPLEQDSRFAAPDWQAWPYNAIYQGFLLTQQWWHNATTEVRGVAPHHEQVVNFAVRQMLDHVAPSNFPWTNPEVVRAALAEGGANFVRGVANFAEDVEAALLERAPQGVERFTPGRQVAVTPGKVVFRNRLIELIQYQPATDTVHAEPLLVIPAWILKYYILDLSPENSLVRYLVGEGHTVFMISWKNPGPADRGLSLHDYRVMGVMDALDAISRIVPDRKVHAAGYCLGGTLLAIAAAAMARDRLERLASVTLLAAQVDFEEAGELTLFMDEGEVALLEDMMAEQGFLDSRQMAGAFQWIRSSDLIWSRRTREYLLGVRAPLNDLAAWNADGTRMPARMHTEYLRRLFLDNDLSEGHYEVEGRPIALRDVKLPIFAVGTSKDHIAPWRSVYKIHLFADADVTFVLASGGHNVGIVSPVNGYAEAGYQVATRHHDEAYLDPDTWAATVPRSAGSWWPCWQRWLAEHSSGRTPPPAMPAALGPAPGEYVLQH
jgi:polyhydroxyalkanoate synthase